MTDPPAAPNLDDGQPLSLRADTPEEFLELLRGT